MAQDPGGGGSATNICTISTSDLVGAVSNLVTRVEVLEAVLSQLLGVNISTVQLSDITNDLGVITAGSFSGGMIANIVRGMGEVNAWAVSGGDPFIQSVDSTGATAGQSVDQFGVASEYGISSGFPTNTVTGAKTANLAYRFASGFYAGGFFFLGRFFFDYGANDAAPPEGIRFFWGLHNGNFLSGSNPTYYNSDDPAFDTELYVGFQYSDPRGDTTFKIALRNQSGAPGGAPTAVYADTGVSIKKYCWYDLSMRCEPTTGTIQWQIVNVTENNATYSGTVPAPSITLSVPDPLDPYPVYNAGFGLWQNSATDKLLLLHHIWAQSLDVNTP